ncbi:wax ester/triacylglycerol synthase family O-acyltransferase [Mycolicibacterium flavescens]|uniref:Diacylglycerol O-acyltransferase n=1 Tax=Mycolicibacterium flavescens TaxID=1776 RepID=A0A1E3R858_MYCFV|nr:wax ester/triacylglycerol synthase family O-acyltransferase [Mycolicibacterium flavescens]MCV7282606.1 wax ester/triacylglycerol synthase family O-acyltransferase [Mycolicibacterium flavescens]ODQ86105.1 diacylglycerol O-acyltransferase [Mycolicibacterium flavescens]
MEQLTILDAGFLQAEDSDPHVSLAIGAIAVLAGPMPDFAVLTAELAERITSVPRFTQVLRTHPLDLGAPEWVDDASLDISHHVRRAAVPRPGDDAALFRWAADVIEHRLDRDRPLWECWVVDGLAHNRWAILIKIHHCMADGVAATQLLTRLCDGYTEPAETRRPPRRRLPAVPLNPVDWLTAAWRTSTGLTAATTQALHGALDIAGGLLRPAAASSLTGPVTDMRRYATVEVSMHDVEKICQRFEVTVNDVALTAITDSFRTMLLRRGEQPRRTSLRTLVPVSVRSGDAAGRADNRVSIMLPYLPVEKSDVLQQLQAVHARMTRAKGSGQRQAGSALIAAANAIPFPVTAWAVRTLGRLPQRGIVTLATNVPGPRKRMRVLGREVIRLLPIPPLAMRLRTGVAMLSYADHLAFGIIGDYDAAPDVDELATGIERAVSELAELSTGHWRSTPAGTLALVQGG